MFVQHKQTAAVFNGDKLSLGVYLTLYIPSHFR